ncbi:DNA helicase, partial [Sarracenia purpurea var. burkii]
WMGRKETQSWSVFYDVVPKLQNILMESEFEVVIADESHFLKNVQANRTRASLSSITVNIVMTLYELLYAWYLEALYPDVYKNVHEYGNRCYKSMILQGIFGIYQGACNHEELHNWMKATVMIRRHKKDVLSEFPVKRRQHVQNIADDSCWA